MDNNIGMKIKNRRIQLNISVDDLAAQIGKNRATIYRYESNEIENMTISVLVPLAKALHTTPAELCGWGEDVIPKDYKRLSQNDNALLSYYHQLNEEGQAKVCEYASDLVDSGKYNTTSNERGA